MSNSFGYLDIILLGMIAGFIILRLRSILGRKTGHETKVYPSFDDKKFSDLFYEQLESTTKKLNTFSQRIGKNIDDLEIDDLVLLVKQS